ncbi:hypothetical protein [Chelativorans sp. YIM 93263]|uniref:hypothetical protein n=1 Tax=Chelativorans sp. YIM 93263 TaxID=2906648 RepID=UPI0023792026|nr:hypothetical protein [Chelativorans sp. YIM 93263]
MKQRSDNETPNAGDSRPRPSIAIGQRRVPIPRTRLVRILSGSLLALLGLFGFLPILGFWMIPVGLLILSYDIATIRRLRRRLEVWWRRRQKKTSGNNA